ncbi:hypothetical protein P7K49_033778 [Saguinus oedipus]|uniref:Uncharacterized protein n=1 Tax=Saguinus oedipus TaxID=9490 RepID=A0ABQ9TSY8_SAGOE|nr:hypothetical protein P7K49_033778 [Saguinus oedipus]
MTQGAGDTLQARAFRAPKEPRAAPRPPQAGGAWWEWLMRGRRREWLWGLAFRVLDLSHSTGRRGRSPPFEPFSFLLPPWCRISRHRRGTTRINGFRPHAPHLATRGL